MKVVIAIDFSSNSQRVVVEAMSRPWPAHTEFQIVHAIDQIVFPLSLEPLEEATRKAVLLVDSAAEKLRGAGHRCETKVLSGSPRHTLGPCAAEWGADLILIGSHGHSALGRFLLGSVAAGILRKASCSVEIVRTHPAEPVPSSRAMKVLLATDGSECSLAAARSIAARPWPAGTVFQILSVEELVTVDTPISAYPSVGVYPQSLLEELVSIAQERAVTALQSARKVLADKGVNSVLLNQLPSTDPRAMILDIAKSWSADLIVLGAHGRRGLDRMLMGSVSETVAFYADCSVEVIRERNHSKN